MNLEYPNGFDDKLNDEIDPDLQPTEPLAPLDPVRNDAVQPVINTLAYSLECGVSSKIGSRSVQQDAARAEDALQYLQHGKLLAMMCDGMGGMNGGELASALCINKMFREYQTKGVNGNIPLFFHKLAEEIDDAVYNLTDEEGESLNAGSTLTAVIIDNNLLYWVSVGDSRIYLKRGDEIVSVTVDHNYRMLLEEKVQNGDITREEADSDPNREALVSYMGVGGIQYIDLNPYPVELIDGDCVLLCSDGLYRTLEKDEILTIIDCFPDASSAAEALTEAAVSKGRRNQDNTTAVLIRFHDNSNTSE